MTDVHFRPAHEIDHTVIVDRPVIIEEHQAGNEMAAFERGRMQGEMEAIRRLESEQNSMVLKQFPAEQAVAPVVVMQPDVVEINRLTWAQRIMAFSGEILSLGYIALLLWWVLDYRGNFGFVDAGDGAGNQDFWNTHLLTSVLGLFFLSQAILLYRVLPIRTPVIVNKALYTFNYLAAATCFSLAIAANCRSEAGTTFWAVDSWCFALGFAVMATHMIYSLIVTWTRPRHVDYETWTETNTRVTVHQSPEQRRDHSIANEAGRTLYTPAPHTGRIARGADAAAHHSTHVPNAPIGAPRWAELPHAHQEDYWLLPRAKWAVCGFIGMGASILMAIAHIQHTLASLSASTWSQGADGERAEPLNQSGREAELISALGLIMLGAVLAITYAAMPPRTTLVKNSTLTDSTRRASISHNAETRIGHQMV